MSSCCCPPSCVIPSCPQPCCSQPCCSQPCCSQPCCSQPCCSKPSCPPCSYPTGGLGKLECCPSSSCCTPSCCGNSTTSHCLGIASGASVACITQIPPSEVVIQPPSCIVTIPGPILAASCEPMKVGGYTACGGCPPCGRICSSSS